MNLFNEDNFLHVFLNRVGDIVIANLLFLVCSIPLFTAGASLTALYHCMLRIARGTNTGITRMFFKSFRENFKQATGAWLILAAAAAILLLNIRFLLTSPSPAAKPLLLLSCGVLILVFVEGLYLFPVLAAFSNRLGALMKNAFLFAFIHFPTTLACALLLLLPLLMTYRDLALLPLYAFCWAFFGFGLIAYIQSLLMYRFFRKYLPGEEKPEQE